MVAVFALQALEKQQEAEKLKAMASTDDVIDEELEEVKEPEVSNDPLYKVRIQKTYAEIQHTGQVVGIDIGQISKDRLYLIKYEDGDMEHLTAEEVEQFRLVDKSKEIKTKGAMPQAKGKAKAKAKSAPKGKAKAAPKTKAKAVIKTVVKGKAKAKAKPKAKVKAKAKAQTKGKK
eukprot:gnl/MRDRNA2_/MRDRNA2_96809_c0_seq1.p1 gnl/MRDRNA2_/MRDRNA2_96809_c0~~gnl/MRDRNA2_/MRDRNA2_96809_c0_seq1.p1  ORF type:complete len:175 (-),score=68.69 gnl/MRDRNA2_/MRDRNA2_96809_c0_seq1:53-577(-)